MKPNPDYSEAELELNLTEIHTGLTMDALAKPRFWRKDFAELANALGHQDWKTVEKLSIPLYTKP